MARPQSRVLYTKPSITDLEVAYATDAAQNGWGDQCYAYIEKFERLFCEHLNVRHAVATSSCTGALHLGLKALGIGPGDEVILADCNWIASVAPVVHLGATPVFVDIDPETWCIDVHQVSNAITPKTKAILAVHLYGNLCNMDELLAVGERAGIPIIEDAAEAIGSTWRAKRAGSMGRFGVFSFHGTKTITTGEGGMLVTNDAQLYDQVCTLNNHGRSKHQTKQFWSDVVGFKYKMSNIQAALGCAQMARIDDLIGRKREIMQRYRTALSGTGIELNAEPAHTVIGAWMPTAVFPKSSGVTREKLQARFAAENIDARVFFWPLSSTPSFSPVRANVVAYDIPTRAINLPSYHDISDDDLARVIAVLKSML